MVDWDIPTGAKELHLALNNVVDKSCTVELQFQCQSLNQATIQMNKLNFSSYSLLGVSHEVVQ